MGNGIWEMGVDRDAPYLWVAAVASSGSGSICGFGPCYGSCSGCGLGSGFGALALAMANAFDKLALLLTW